MHGPEGPSSARKRAMIGNCDQAGKVANFHMPQDSQKSGRPISKIDRGYQVVLLACLPMGMPYWRHIAVGSPQSLPDRIHHVAPPPQDSRLRGPAAMWGLSHLLAQIYWLRFSGNYFLESSDLIAITAAMKIATPNMRTPIPTERVARKIPMHNTGIINTVKNARAMMLRGGLRHNTIAIIPATSAVPRMIATRRARLSTLEQ